MKRQLILLFLFFIADFALLNLPRLFGGQACLWAESPKSISYQGRLRESGQPVSGTRSIQFKLFDASSAGAEVFNSGAQSIYVSSGIFGYQLGGQNFKDLSWATSSYWLEISVGGNAMTPREQINAMPYAFMASTAASLNGAGNIQITGAGPHYILNGNIGIGTTAPETKMHVKGDARIEGALNINSEEIYAGKFNLGSGTAGNWYKFMTIDVANNYSFANLKGFVSTDGGSAGQLYTNEFELRVKNQNSSIMTAFSRKSKYASADMKAMLNGTVLTLYVYSPRDYSYLSFNISCGRSDTAGITQESAPVIEFPSGTELTNLAGIQFDGTNVGIGTTSPASALDVNGTAKAMAFQGSGSGLTGIPTSALADGAVTQAVMDTSTADQSTTSTSWIPTDLSVSVTTTGGPLLILASIPFYSVQANYGGGFNIQIDGTGVESSATYGFTGTVYSKANSLAGVATIVYLKQGLSAGAHTVTIMYRAESASYTFTKNGNSGQANLVAIELKK